MWLVAHGLLLLWLLAWPVRSTAQPPSSIPIPCAQWTQRFQSQLQRDNIPAALTRVLDVHRGHGLSTAFTEEKHIAVLRRPLASSGHLIFIPSQGLYRQLQTPFTQELLITPDAIHQRGPQGRTEVFRLTQIPVAKAFVEAFLALFSGSWATLHTHFDVYFSSDDAQWQIGLKPSHQIMASVIACLVLEGADERLSRLWVQETNGDVTYNQFSQPELLAPEQWTTYHAQFEWAQ